MKFHPIIIRERAIYLLKNILIFLSILLSSNAIVAQEQDLQREKDRIHDWMRQNHKPLPPSIKKIPNEQLLSTQIDRVKYGCESKFLLGANVAWNSYYYDLSNTYYDGSFFETMFTQVQAEGGNSMRFWLHANGAAHPLFQDSQDPNRCTGIAAQDTINLKDLLNRAWNHGIRIQICLWSHNMLTTNSQTGMNQAVRNRNRLILESNTYRNYYIQNALLSFVRAVKGHPGLLAWEVFNEAEGISINIPHRGNTTSWPGYESTNYSNVLASVNHIAAAIHREDPNALVTTGTLDIEYCSTVDGNANYYHNDTLLKYGGDADGYLDFYTVHYYDWAGAAHSPFDKPVSYWKLDKPLVIAEFYPQETFGAPQDSLFKYLYDQGYAGAWGWCYKYNPVNPNYWENMRLGMRTCHNHYAQEIDWENLNCNALNAIFTVNKFSGCTGETFIYTDESTNSPDSWNWDFGSDATPATATGKGPHVVTYATTGSKDVMLTVKKGAAESSLTKTALIQLSQGNTLSIAASNKKDCSGALVNFTSSIGPALPAGTNINAVPTGPFSIANPILSYQLSSDGTINPSLSNCSNYLHGNWNPQYGNEVEFTGVFGSGATAAIYALTTSQPSETASIYIDGVLAGSKLFLQNTKDSYSVSVPAGRHTIKFKGGTKGAIQIEKYAFANLENPVTYKWYLNGSEIPGETRSTYSSTTLKDGDEVSAEAYHSNFNCLMPSINSNIITMDCIVTSIEENSDNSFQVYPNPVSDVLFLNEVVSWELYTLQGQFLISGIGNQITFSSLKNGTYILKTRTKEIRIIKM